MKFGPFEISRLGDQYWKNYLTVVGGDGRFYVGLYRPEPHLTGNQTLEQIKQDLERNTYPDKLRLYAPARVVDDVLPGFDQHQNLVGARGYNFVGPAFYGTIPDYVTLRWEMITHISSLSETAQENLAAAYINLIDPPKIETGVLLSGALRGR